MGRAELPITHGTLTGYRKGCRCEPCRAKKAESRKPHPTDPQSDAAVAQPAPETAAAAVREPGPVERIVADDLASMASSVPLAKSFSAIARSLAREMDQVQDRREGGSIAGTAGRLLAVLNMLQPAAGPPAKSALELFLGGIADD